MMGRRLFAILVCVAVLGAGLLMWILFAQRATNAQEKADPSQTFDFGEARVGETVRHTFVLANRSGRPIRVRKVLTDCACTNVSGMPDVIGAHESRDVTVSVVLGKESDRLGAGVTVLTEPEGTIRLLVVGTVKRDLPAEVSFGRMRRGETVIRTIGYEPLAGPRNDVGQVDCDARYMAARIQPSPENSIRQQIVITTAPEIPYGPFAVDVVARMADANQPARIIKCTGTVVPPVEVVPARLAVALKPGQEVAHERVLLRSEYGSPIDGVKVVSSVGVEASVDGVTPGANNEVAVALTVRVPPQGGVTEGRVEFETSGARSERCLLRIYALRASGQ